MRRIGSFFVVLFISVGLLGGVAEAGASNGVSVPTAESLVGGKFRSVKTTGKKNLGNRQIRIRFFNHSPHASNPRKPTVSVRAGCNTWGATFRVRRGRLSLNGPISGTKMVCKEDHDPWIKRKFRKGLKVRVRGKRLILTRPAERVRFVFQRVNSKRQGPGPEHRITVPATEGDVHGKEYGLIDAIGEKVDQGLKLRFRDWLKTDGDGNLVPASSLVFYSGRYRVNGTYGITDGVLSWNDFCPSGMWCHPMDDPWLRDYIAGGPKVGLDGTDLVLRKGGIELVFAQIGGPDTPDPEPRVTVPATMDDVLYKSYEAISVIGPELDRPLKISFAVGTQTGKGGPVTGPTLGYYAGCNHLAGWASIENGTLSWTEVIGTQIGCWGWQDEWLIPFFEKSPQIGLDGTDLVIRKNGVEIVLRQIES